MAMSSFRSISSQSWLKFDGDGCDYRLRCARVPASIPWRALAARASVNGVCVSESLGATLKRSPRQNSERFNIRSYEVGENRRASVVTMVNFLQEAACNHARIAGFSLDGFATTLSMRKYGLIWIMTRIHVEVDEYPQWGDSINIDTWFQFEGKNGTRREWRVMNTKSGKVIARATSTMALMNQQTRRLARINDDVRNEFCLYVKHPPSSVFVEDSFKKPISKLDKYQHERENLMPSSAELDMNQHVNNAAYIGWVLESLPPTARSNRELRSLTLEFRSECKRDDAVTASASFEESESNSEVESFTHLIKLSGSHKEVSRSRTAWGKIRTPSLTST